MRRNYGFTLIELLIVVAIIAILAAIAVPNFLDAQVRSKVSRTKADLRTYATAIEAYYVDHSKPPREYCTGCVYGDPLINGGSASGIVFPGAERTGGVIQHGLSTPVAYLSTAWIIDVFTDPAIPQDEQRYTYQDLVTRADGVTGTPSFSPAFAAAALNYYGNWRMCSIGPDRTFSNQPTSATNAAQMVYDPTNGTISSGNIWRSQNRTDSEQPPVGPITTPAGTATLLGPH